MEKKARMTRVLKAACIIFVLLLFVGLLPALLWPYVVYDKSERTFFAKLEAEITEGHTSIPVASIADFEWDRVCLFDYGGDAQPTSQILSKQGISEDVDESLSKKLQSIRNASDASIFVFIKNAKLVNVLHRKTEILRISNVKYRFDLGQKDCYDTEATFEVVLDENEALLRLTE